MFLTIYMFLYLVNLLCLSYIIKSSISENINIMSLPSIHSHIMTYSNLKNLYVSLLLTLSGLPPFIMFFVKFNFLLDIFTRVNFISCVLVYITIFISMLFYIQPFLNKKYNKNTIIFLNKNDTINHKIIFIIECIVWLTFLSIFFFPDVYYVTFLIFS